MMSNAVRVSLVAALCLASFCADARSRRSPEDEERACKPDVFRLCRDAIPSQEKIIACLKQKRKQLRPACRKVMSR
ncbi:MAG: cysteine rich repeat-containing protein [Rhodomicrobium sp.]